ncbi:MAG: YibE/F family protein, partial [Lachnospiraceae bacterium]|nr:YibE/F family protein [Lachnospiraceae bacterium]
ISGMNVDEIETLLFIQQNSHIDIGGMLFSSILIASLGAVMDVAMSVSSSMTEICDKVPNITRKELFRSGLRIGRDMIGTMSNTLILAFVGGSLNLVMIIYAYQYPLHQVLNMYSLGIEWMKGIAGTMGIVFTVPLTAAAASYFLLRNAGVSQSKA